MPERLPVATIFVNGVFDLLHEGHIRFLKAALALGGHGECNRLIAALNSDESARRLKAHKWGPKYPRDNQVKRAEQIKAYVDDGVMFNTEAELREIVEWFMPCVIVKGPDYANKRVTGDDIAPVIILATPETDEVRQLKRGIYGIS